MAISAKPWFKGSMRSTSSLLLVAAVLALAASDAGAYWTREEWIGYQPETGRYRTRVADLAIYESHWGPGVGITAFEIIAGAWDVPRFGRQPDASGHYIYEIFPLKAYLALVSWKGPPYFHMLDRRAADRSIGKLELYGSYCGWAQMTEFNEVSPTVINVDLGRDPVPGSVRVKLVDYGIRADQGLGSSFSLAASIGRLEFVTTADQTFRARSLGRWYAAVNLYFGATHGSDYGGGAGRMLVDVWDWLHGLFGGSVVHEGPLPSTTE